MFVYFCDDSVREESAGCFVILYFLGSILTFIFSECFETLGRFVIKKRYLIFVKQPSFLEPYKKEGI